MNVVATTLFTTLIFFQTQAFASLDLLKSPAQKRAEAALASDIAVLKAMRFSHTIPLYTTTFGKAADGPYRFYASRVKRTVWDSKMTKGALAYMTNDQSMYYGAKYATVRQLLRISTLIHEATHGEAGRGHHVWCPEPFVFRMQTGFYGEPNFVWQLPQLQNILVKGCDTSGNGAFGVQFAFLSSVQYACTNCSAAMKAEADKIKLNALVRVMNPKAASILWNTSFPPESAPVPK